MSTSYFVAVDPTGYPVAQRSSAREYLSANTNGEFRSAKPTPAHPLHVVKVAKPLEWRLTLAAGNFAKVELKSRACGWRGRYLVRFKLTEKTGRVTERTSVYADRAGWEQDVAAFAKWGHKAEAIAQGAAEQTIKNFPQERRP